MSREPATLLAGLGVGPVGAALALAPCAYAVLAVAAAQSPRMPRGASALLYRSAVLAWTLAPLAWCAVLSARALGVDL